MGQPADVIGPSLSIGALAHHYTVSTVPDSSPGHPSSVYMLRHFYASPRCHHVRQPTTRHAATGTKLLELSHLPWYTDRIAIPNQKIPKPFIPAYNFSQTPSLDQRCLSYHFVCLVAVISRARSLLGPCETDSRVAHVVHRVPLPEESVTENSKRTGRLREVHSHESRDARSLDLKNVIVRVDGEVVASERESKVGQTVALAALDRVLTVEALLGTNLLVAVPC
jgi:hypothetical protein